MSDSSSSTSGSDSEAFENNVNAPEKNALNKDESAVFTDSVSENESLNNNVSAIIATLDSPRRKKSTVSSCISNKSIGLSGLKFSPLNTSSSANTVPRRPSSELSSDECETSQSSRNLSKKVVQRLFLEKKKLKFENPKDFQAIELPKELDVSAEELQEDELWLIKAPRDFDTSLLQLLDVSADHGVITREDIAGEDAVVWKARAYTGSKAIKDLNVVAPSKTTHQLVCAGKLHGELQVYKAFDVKPYVIPKTTKVPPSAPEDARLRYKPFGSERASDMSVAQEILHEESVDAIKSPMKSAKKSKKKKRKLDVDPDTDTLVMHSPQASSVNKKKHKHDVGPDVTDTFQTSSVNKKKKKRKSEITAVKQEIDVSVKKHKKHKRSKSTV